MAERPEILVVDDGELEDVCEVLRELGASFDRRRGAGSGEPLQTPRSLLVISPRHALGLGLGLARQRGPQGLQRGPAGVVIVAEDSPVLRSMLRQAGFDFLVRRPLHRAALRLLLLRALYHGPERRLDPRLPSGCHVHYRAGVRREPCVLADVSVGGCRLLSTRPVPRGAEIEVLLSEEVTGSEPLTVAGRVVRCEQGDTLESIGAGYALGVRFESITAADRVRLRAIVTLGLVGTRIGGERRAGARRSFRRKVSALCSEAGRVLMGRDLSTGGMKVEWHPALKVGDTLTLAIHLEEDESPLVVDAQVVRDDGPEGMALCFERVSEEAAHKLERLVGDLPGVELLAAGEIASLGAVLSEILASSSTSSQTS